MGQQGLLPFERSFYWADISADSGLLGSEFEMANGKRYRIVEGATGSTYTGRRVVKWSSKTAKTVTYTTASGDRPCGVIADELNGVTIPSGAAFAVQIKGEAEVILGSGASAVTAGHLIKTHSDTDKGKVMTEGGAVLTSAQKIPVIIGRAIDAASGTDTVFTIDLDAGSLEGA